MFIASYSKLKAWVDGDIDMAIGKSKQTPQMQAGSKYHSQWAREIRSSRSLPVVFGGAPLSSPEVEQSFRREISPWLELRGRMDLLDGEVGYDWKTGVTPAEAYATSHQHHMYQILIPRLRFFRYFSYNPQTQEVSSVIVELNERTLEEGMDWLITHASSMKFYLEAHGRN